MKRLWRPAVMDALQRLAAANQSPIVTRKQLVREELPRIIAESQTKGRFPKNRLSRELQLLRDDGIIEFQPPGRYRLLKQVEDAETFEGNDRELDTAIIERRLRLGRVETGEERAIQKRRRGQERLRELALDFYGRRCALCDMKDKAFLIASHISPWAESVDGRGDLTNVIILCRPHDSLFEFGYWSLSNDLTILRKQANRPPWVIDALLPAGLSFRAPNFHGPAENYLEAHRIRNQYG